MLLFFVVLPSFKIVILYEEKSCCNKKFSCRHGKGQVFSCRGIQLVIDFFKERGHTQITAFVPQWREKNVHKHQNKITEHELLEEMQKNNHLVYTPARNVAGRNIVSYDDRSDTSKLTSHVECKG